MITDPAAGTAAIRGEGVAKRLCSAVGTAIVADCLDALGADAGFVGTIAADGRTLDVARVTPFAQKPVRLSFPLDAPYPLAETVRTKRPLFIADNEQLRCEHPGLVRVKSEDHACATLPLLSEDGELLGAVNFGFEEPHSFDDEELELIGLIGQRCAEAMTTARRLETELQTRTSARAAPAAG